MSKFIEKDISIILLTITCYFLLSISNSLKETSNYSSDLRAYAKMKAFNNVKESSDIFKRKAAVVIKFLLSLLVSIVKN